MFIDAICPYCKKEFPQSIELAIDDGDVVCSDSDNCPHCEKEIVFSVEVTVTTCKSDHTIHNITDEEFKSLFGVKRHWAIVTSRLVKQTKGKNAGKYKVVQEHGSFDGTFEELEEYLRDNRLVLLGYDYID